MGGMLRCIRNEYNLDQVENEINRTDSINYDEVFQSIKQKTNIYIDDDNIKTNENDNDMESDHYTNNSLNIIKEKKKTLSMYIPSSKVSKFNI